MIDYDERRETWPVTHTHTNSERMEKKPKKKKTPSSVIRQEVGACTAPLLVVGGRGPFYVTARGTATCNNVRRRRRRRTR